MVSHLGLPRAIKAPEYDRVTVARPVDLGAVGLRIRRMPISVPSSKTTLTNSECNTERTQGRKPLIIAQSTGCFVSRCLWILNWTQGVNTSETSSPLLLPKWRILLRMPIDTRKPALDPFIEVYPSQCLSWPTVYRPTGRIAVRTLGVRLPSHRTPSGISCLP